MQWNDTGYLISKTRYEVRTFSSYKESQIHSLVSVEER